jgi:enolase
MNSIASLTALEILDSRGWPTVKTTCTLADGTRASASIPSGRSTGAAEACELRDGDPARYRGKGCRQAVDNVNTTLHEALKATAFASQRELDEALITIDGSPNKQRLGANALLSVSIAFARARAAQQNLPLHDYFARLVERQPGPPAHFPRLTINLFSGGRHAGKQVAIQDVLIVPSAARSIDESLVMMNDIYHAAADRTFAHYGMRLLTADEGGLAPPFEDSEAMLQAAVAAIESAGWQPGRDVHLALDIAASHFYRDGRYLLDEHRLPPPEMIENLSDWCRRYPIVSLEDGLAEDDWQHWPLLQQALGEKVLILGDDLLCTNPERIRRAIDSRACNGLLLKVNQIGTLSEAAAARSLAKAADWQVTISVRSGETEDDWAADLAVGWAADQFKNGSITQSERLAKYNRLLEIEAQRPMSIINWPLR